MSVLSRFVVPILVLALSGPVALEAQTANILIPVDSVEYLLSEADFELPDTLVGTRFEGDRTQRVPLWFDEWTGVLVKWAPAPEGGEEFNNVPRYEIAAYELQKLFLEESEYVVPPTVPRMLPLDWYRTLDEDVEPTFDFGRSCLVVLQYFLYGVTTENVFDEDRFESDTTYARHWANVNLLTHFIQHKDSNEGNLLISTNEENPRVFAVDNGVAFESEESNRGRRWARLQMDRVPRATINRLSQLTEEEVREALGVLAQFELRGDELVRVPPTENLSPRRGIREDEDRGIVQIGLTRSEIGDVWYRIEGVLSRVANGRLEVF